VATYLYCSDDRKLVVHPPVSRRTVVGFAVSYGGLYDMASCKRAEGVHC
jgi:hypothetical protein